MIVTLCDILTLYNGLQIVNQLTREKNILNYFYANIFSPHCMIVRNEFSDHNNQLLYNFMVKLRVTVNLNILYEGYFPKIM